MSRTSSTKPDLDPLGLLKPLQGAMLETWTRAIHEVMATREFSESLARALAGPLAGPAALPLRMAADQAVEKSLATLKLPSRGDVATLTQRVARLEKRLDALDARSVEILAELRALRVMLEPPPAPPIEPPPASPARPARARKKTAA